MPMMNTDPFLQEMDKETVVHVSGVIPATTAAKSEMPIADLDDLRSRLAALSPDDLAALLAELAQNQALQPGPGETR